MDKGIERYGPGPGNTSKTLGRPDATGHLRAPPRISFSPQISTCSSDSNNNEQQQCQQLTATATANTQRATAIGRAATLMALARASTGRSDSILIIRITNSSKHQRQGHLDGAGAGLDRVRRPVARRRLVLGERHVVVLEHVPQRLPPPRPRPPHAPRHIPRVKLSGHAPLKRPATTRAGG